MVPFLREILCSSLAGSLCAVIVMALNKPLRKASARTRMLLWIPVYAGYILPYVFRMPAALWTWPDAFRGPIRSAVRFFHAHAGVLMLVWLTGFAGWTAYSLVSGMRLKRRFKEASGGEVLVRPDADSPFTIGLFHPSVILPEGLSETETDYILLHENAHRTRRDPLKKMSVYLITLLHWFDPLAWMALSRFEADLETACDETAVSSLSRKERAAYAMTLLYYRPKKNSSWINSYKTKDSVMKQRIAHITSEPAETGTSRLSVYALTVLLCAADCIAPCGVMRLLSAGEQKTEEIILPARYLTENGRVPVQGRTEEYLGYLSPEWNARILSREEDDRNSLHIFMSERYYERTLTLLYQNIEDAAERSISEDVLSASYDSSSKTLTVVTLQTLDEYDLTVLNLLYPILEYEVYKGKSLQELTVTVENRSPDDMLWQKMYCRDFDPYSLEEAG